MIEFSNIQSIYSREYLKNPNTLTVIWKLGSFCNYSCSYCWPGAHSSEYDYKKTSVYKLALDNLVDQAIANKFNKIILVFLGGELTTYKGFLDLIKYINDIDSVEIKLDLVTNLSPPIGYWDRFIQASKNIEVNFIASYHFEFSNLDTFLKKVKHIQSSGTSIMVSLVMNPIHFDILYDVAERIKSIHSYYSFNFEYDQNDKLSTLYTESMIEKINQLNNYSGSNNVYVIDKDNNQFSLPVNFLISNNMMNFRNWNCDAGFTSIVVDNLFNVRRCWSSVDPILGNLKTGFQLKKSKCITTGCICFSDIKIKKDVVNV